MWNTFIPIRLMRQLKHTTEPKLGVMSRYTIKDDRTTVFIYNFICKTIQFLQILQMMIIIAND